MTYKPAYSNVKSISKHAFYSFIVRLLLSRVHVGTNFHKFVTRPKNHNIKTSTKGNYGK